MFRLSLPLLFNSSVDCFAHVQVTYTVGRDPLSVKNIVAESSPLFSAPVIVRTKFCIIDGTLCMIITMNSRIMISYFLIKLQIAGPPIRPHSSFSLDNAHSIIILLSRSMCFQNTLISIINLFITSNLLTTLLNDFSNFWLFTSCILGCCFCNFLSPPDAGFGEQEYC